MANLPNFLGAPDIQYSAMDQAFQNALKGYREGVDDRNYPQKTAYSLEDQRLGNVLKEAQGRHQVLTNEHLPTEFALGDEQKRLANELQKILNPMKKFEADHQAELFADDRTKASQEAMKRMIDLQMQGAKNEADVALTQTQADVLGDPRSKMGDKQRMLFDAYGGNEQSPEYQAALKQAAGIPTIPGELPKGLPIGSYSMASLSESEQKDIGQRQDEQITNLNKEMEVIDLLHDMDAIQKKHPKMGQSMFAILSNGADDGVFKELTKKFSNKEELDAITRFQKDAARVVRLQSEATGGKITNSIQDMINNSKPQAGNPGAANQQIIKDLLGTLKHVKPKLEALEKGQQYRYVVPTSNRLYVPSGDTEAAHDYDAEATTPEMTMIKQALEDGSIEIEGGWKWNDLVDTAKKRGVPIEEIYNFLDQEGRIHG